MTYKKGKLTASICCPNPYFFDHLKDYMNFRTTSAQTSGEKNFGKFLLAQKNRPQISWGLYGGDFNIWLHFMTLNREKHPLEF